MSADFLNFRPVIASLLLGIGCFLVGSPQATAQGSADAALYITVPSPLTSGGYNRIKERIETARSQPERRPATIIFDFNPGDKEAATQDFGTCYDLADTIAKLLDTNTIAYVHQKVSGHTVLPVLACKEIVVGPDAALGEIVSKGEPPLAGLRENGYKELIGQTQPAYLGIVRKMYDPATKLRKGRKGGADVYVDIRNDEMLAKEGITVTDTRALPSAPDGVLGLFTASQLRDIGLARATVETRGDLLEAYGLSASILREDPLGGRAPVAFRYILRGQVDGGVREAVVRMAKDVIRKKGNLLFLQLECSGGDLTAARELADDLRQFQTGTTEEKLLIVAYIPDKAPDTAAVIALGCSDIVMSKRQDVTAGGAEPEEATFGDFEDVVAKERNIDFVAASLRELASAQGYPPILIDGMLKRDLELVQVARKTNRSIRRIMTSTELEADKARGEQSEWTAEKVIKPKGVLLKLNATQAEQLGLARSTVDNRDPAAVFARYGVEASAVREATPAWLDRFSSILRMPTVTVLLVVIGFTGLILELKVPGTTVPGIVAAMCFILVFWAHTQFSGQVAVLAGLLFLLGFVLVLMEVFVLPGFGAAGVSGIILMLAGLGLVTVDRIPETTAEWGVLGGRMGQYLIAMMASVALAFFIARYLPNIPYANRLMLPSPADKPETPDGYLPGAAEAAALLGAVGTAVTVLRPAGSVRFGDSFVDVVTEGGFIPAGARVQVIEVESTRIVVREV